MVDRFDQYPEERQAGVRQEYAPGIGFIALPPIDPAVFDRLAERLQVPSSDPTDPEGLRKRRIDPYRDISELPYEALPPIFGHDDTAHAPLQHYWGNNYTIGEIPKPRQSTEGEQ